MLLQDTYYEELVCVGYQPQQWVLEGVVHVYQPSGYGSNLCGPGTPEFVRFYISYDHGATWLDQGLTSFVAHDIPGTSTEKKLEYAVQLPIQPQPKLCVFDPVITVRAILSWNNPPPPNQPDWDPIWGNVKTVPILVEPYRLMIWPDIVEIAKLKPLPILDDLIAPDIPIPTKQKAFSPAELAEKYKEFKVPPKRYAFKELTQMFAANLNISAVNPAQTLGPFEINEELIKNLFFATDGDISYEELTCIGLDPNFPDTLVGVVWVKKPCGYSGGPCSYGSHEYVTFWADFDNNNTFETCLGTTQVQVYDVTVPDKGIFYAVRLPVDLNPYRQNCKAGAKVVKIRAILSWNVPVPETDPDKVPVWGNREETLIQITPTPAKAAGQIAVLGGIPVSFIDDVTGLTTKDAVFAVSNLPPDDPSGVLGLPQRRPCPFGGRVSVHGYPIKGYSYRVDVKPAVGGTAAPVVTKLILTKKDGTTFTHLADPTTFQFAYIEPDNNIFNLLAEWDTAGNEKWEVKLTVFDGSGTQVGLPDTHLIQLDNTWPEAHIEIKTPVGNCGKVTIGTPMSGVFVARDDYLSFYDIYVIPDINPGTSNPVPSRGIVQSSMSPGDIWNLNTTGKVECGYVIVVGVHDRAILDSASVGHHNYDSAGFCLMNKA